MISQVQDIFLHLTILHMVPQEGIEPSTSPLPRECSTSKLLWQSPSNGTTGYTKLQKIKGCRKTGAGNQGECVVT